MENTMKHYPCSEAQNKEVEVVLKRLTSARWPEDIYAAREYYDQWGAAISNEVSIKEISFSQFKGYLLTPKNCQKRTKSKISFRPGFGRSHTADSAPDLARSHWNTRHIFPH